MIGTTVGSYRITHKLAEGGMGAVYVAVHDIMEREAVVKVLLPDMSTKTAMVKRFFNEARAAASIHHPGIVEVFDVGYAADGRAFIIMEKLQGETLSARLRREPMAPAKAAQVVRQLASALAAAHKRNIIHRDLKPDNVFLVPDPEVKGGERVKILDFGIAKLAVNQKGSLMTAAGAIFGTPAYMAPEQCSDAATVDHRADIYALGCILYECLTGRPPFGHGGLQLLAAHLRDQPEPPSRHRPQLGADLDGITLQLLAKDPGHRFQTCTALADALRSIGGTLPEGFPSRQQSVVPAPSRGPSLGAAEGQAFAPTVDSAPAVASGTVHSGGVGTYMDPAALAGQQPVAAGVTTTTTHGAGAGEVSTAASRGEHPPQRSSRRAVFLAVGALVAAGIGVAVALTVGGGGNKGESANATPPAETPSEKPAMVAADAGLPVRAAMSPTAVTKLLQEADDHLVKRRWSKAAQVAKQALAQPGIVDGDRARGEQIAKRAAAERTNQSTFVSLVRAADNNDTFSVARLADQIPEDSFYRPAAVASRNRARDEWVTPRLKKAGRYAQQRKSCSAIEGYASQARPVFPAVAAQFDGFVKTCRRKVASSGDKKPAPARPKPAATRPTVSTAELVAQAKNAVRSSLFAKGLRLCSEALRRGGGGQEAVLVCAVAACNLKMASRSKRYIRRLTGGRKGMVRQICLRNGVNVD